MHLALALSSNFINVLAEIADGVSAVVSVSRAADTRGGDHGRRGVREALNSVLALGETGARVISEQTQADLSSLVSTVGANVVVNVLVSVVAVGIGVVLQVTAHVELVASCVFGHVVSALLSVHALHIIIVGFHVGLHVDNVVSVVRSAASQVGEALTGRAKSEAHKTLGHDADIVFIIDIWVPLLDMVASLELDVVSGKEARINLSAVVGFNTTGMLHDVLCCARSSRNVSILGVDGRALGGGNESQSNNSDTREHGGVSDGFPTKQQFI